nr:translation initiation factor IF-2-like [Equus asinus]
MTNRKSSPNYSVKLNQKRRARGPPRSRRARRPPSPEPRARQSVAARSRRPPRPRCWRRRRARPERQHKEAGEREKAAPAGAGRAGPGARRGCTAGEAAGRGGRPGPRATPPKRLPTRPPPRSPPTRTRDPASRGPGRPQPRAPAARAAIVPAPPPPREGARLRRRRRRRHNNINTAARRPPAPRRPAALTRPRGRTATGEPAGGDRRRPGGRRGRYPASPAAPRSGPRRPASAAPLSNRDAGRHGARPLTSSRRAPPPRLAGGPRGGAAPGPGLRGRGPPSGGGATYGPGGLAEVAWRRTCGASAEGGVRGAWPGAGGGGALALALALARGGAWRERPASGPERSASTSQKSGAPRRGVGRRSALRPNSPGDQASRPGDTPHRRRTQYPDRQYVPFRGHLPWAQQPTTNKCSLRPPGKSCLLFSQNPPPTRFQARPQSEWKTQAEWRPKQELREDLERPNFSSPAPCQELEYVATRRTDTRAPCLQASPWWSRPVFISLCSAS